MLFARAITFWRTYNINNTYIYICIQQYDVLQYFERNRRLKNSNSLFLWNMAYYQFKYWYFIKWYRTDKSGNNWKQISFIRFVWHKVTIVSRGFQTKADIFIPMDRVKIPGWALCSARYFSVFIFLLGRNFRRYIMRIKKSIYFCMKIIKYMLYILKGF